MNIGFSFFKLPKIKPATVFFRHWPTFTKVIVKTKVVYLAETRGITLMVSVLSVRLQLTFHKVVRKQI